MNLTIDEEMNWLMRNFLVHSYLYYKLDTSIIKDHKYDELCVRLKHMIEDHKEVAQKHEYYHICKEVGNDASGYFIEQYPPEIITSALRAAWLNARANSPGFNQGFGQYIKQWGFEVY